MTIQADTTESSNYSSTDEFHLVEASVRMGNVFETQPDVEILGWVSANGQRRPSNQPSDRFSTSRPTNPHLAELWIPQRKRRPLSPNLPMFSGPHDSPSDDQLFRARTSAWSARRAGDLVSVAPRERPVPAARLLPLRLVAVRAGSRPLQKFLFLGDKSRVLLLNLFENLLAFR